jgi:hypothetical protein
MVLNLDFADSALNSPFQWRDSGCLSRGGAIRCTVTEIPPKSRSSRLAWKSFVVTGALGIHILFEMNARTVSLFEKLKKGRSDKRAKQKFADYEKLYRNTDDSAMRPQALPMEETFDAFVEHFGGVKISSLIKSKSSMPLNADYLFKDHNVIAELKTLEGIYSGPTALNSLTQAFIDSGFPSSEVFGLLLQEHEMPDRVRDMVGKRIRRAIEQRIKMARRQLRQSKANFGDGSTRTLILVAMDQEPLFGHRMMLRQLAKLMDDNYADEHTDGIVYLNPNTPTKMKPDGMEFSGWFPVYRDEGNKDGLGDFVNLLGNRWLTYHGSMIGETNPILELDSSAEMMVALREQYRE